MCQISVDASFILKKNLASKKFIINDSPASTSGGN